MTGRPRDICLIPARAGSQRVANKNALTIQGRSLVEIAIAQAQASRLFAEVHFSSDDDALLASAEAAGARVFRRSPELAGSNSGLIAVIQHHLTLLGLAPDDSLCLLPVTNALRRLEDLRGGYELFEAHGRRDSVISVCVNEHPVELLFEMADGHLRRYLQRDLVSTRKQDFTPTYFWNDAFVIDTARAWGEPGRLLYASRMVPYVMPPERSVAIDDPFQVVLTRALYDPT